MERRIIKIKRNRPFVHEAINSEAAQEALSATKNSIGSYFAGKHSSRKGTGLNDVEVQLLLPLVLDMDSSDRDFRKAVADYYTEIDTNVPYLTGRELDITLESEQEDIYDLLKGKSKVRKGNMPLNTEDYVRFRHALSYPGTQPSFKEAKGNLLCDFYIEDPEQEINTKIGKIEIEDAAMADYQAIKNDATKSRMIVTLLRQWLPKKANMPQPIIHKLQASEITLLLRELAIRQPEKFHEIANDELVQKKYMVDELLSVGLLRRTQNVIFITDDNTSIGDSLKDAVMYLFDAKNSHKLNELKALYKEKTKDRGSIPVEETKKEETPVS